MARLAQNYVSGTRRIATDVLLKQSIRSSEAEFQNQMHAWKLCDPAILRVAQPIRWFERADSSDMKWSFFLMEYLPGVTLEDHIECAPASETLSTAARVYDAIRHLHSMPLEPTSPPGPLHGTMLSGFPWGDYALPCQLRSVADLERLLLRILDIGSERRPAQLRFASLHLVHGDLAARNIMLLEDHSIAVLDWATLSYYPIDFEIAALGNAERAAGSTQEARLLGWIREKMDRSEDGTTYWLARVQSICVTHSVRGALVDQGV